MARGWQLAACSTLGAGLGAALLRVPAAVREAALAAEALAALAASDASRVWAWLQAAAAGQGRGPASAAAAASSWWAAVAAQPWLPVEGRASGDGAAGPAVLQLCVALTTHADTRAKLCADKAFVPRLAPLLAHPWVAVGSRLFVRRQVINDQGECAGPAGTPRGPRPPWRC